MSEQGWLRRYVERFTMGLRSPDVFTQLIELKDICMVCHSIGKKAIFAGNGGSAAIASHCAVDFTKNAGIRCVNFNEADLITCFANDYGYALWLQKALEFYADDGDVVVLISSSGQSPNIVNAAGASRAKGLKVVTLTGFSPDNPLRGLGDLNLWVNSQEYNVVEMTHQTWLLAVCDLIIASGAAPPAMPEQSVARQESYEGNF